MKLNPHALAECGDSELDARPNVQSASEHEIYAYVIGNGELPTYSAKPFAEWLDMNWNDWNEDGDRTISQVIYGALADWRGDK